MDIRRIILIVIVIITMILVCIATFYIAPWISANIGYEGV